MWIRKYWCNLLDILGYDNLNDTLSIFLIKNRTQISTLELTYDDFRSIFTIFSIKKYCLRCPFKYELINLTNAKFKFLFFPVVVKTVNQKTVQMETYKLLLLKALKLNKPYLTFGQRLWKMSKKLQRYKQLQQ